MGDARTARPVPGEAVQEVRSAEQVALHFPIAGPGTRILAYTVDFAVLVLLQVAAFAVLLLATPLAAKLSELIEPIVEGARSGEGVDELARGGLLLFMGLFLIGQLVVEWIYFVGSERVSGGRSLGKRAIGLRVMGTDGLPLTLRASLVRNLLRAVDVLPGGYLVGLVALVVSTKGQRLGDLAAGTIVVRLDAGGPFDDLDDEFDQAAEAADGSFRFSHQQLSALGAPERQLLRQTLRRLTGLDAEHAAAVLARTVEVLRARLDYEPVEPARQHAFLQALRRAVSHR